MDLEFTRHAREKMAERRISREEVERVLLNHYRTIDQEDTYRYHAEVGGRRLGAVVKKGTSPLRIITAFDLEEGLE